MLYVRYSAFFPLTGSERREIELVLSLVTLERQLFRYTSLTVVVYTLSAYKQSYVDLCAKFAFPSQVMALDQEYAPQFARWQAIAAEIQHKTTADRHCIVRMLADFHILPTDAHRLLIGCDVFFLDVPQEVLRFLWSEKKEAAVLYLTDVYSFAGIRYRLPYYHPPILEGLLGDFYCLAPGVHLTEESIHGCLKMIDAWPTGSKRWDPELAYDGTHACEQQAAAILLQCFGGEPLPTERYSHVARLPGTAVLHTHEYEDILRMLDPSSLEQAKRLFEAWAKTPESLDKAVPFVA